MRSSFGCNGSLQLTLKVLYRHSVTDELRTIFAFIFNAQFELIQLKTDLALFQKRVSKITGIFKKPIFNVSKVQAPVIKNS